MTGQAIKAGILGTGSYLPSRVVTNLELEKTVDTTDEWIRTRSGISERRIAAADEFTSDMGAEAARRALNAAGTKIEEIDLILCATMSPDYPFPSTACVIQQKLGAFQAGAADLSAACSGFLYAMATARGFVESGMARRVLIIGAEKMSGILDWKDRGTCVLFGDGASAAVIGPTEKRGRILSSHLGADGRAVKALFQPAGGVVKPATLETVAERLHFLTMDGKEVYKFAVRVMGEASECAIEKAGLKPEDISLFIPHQANIRIIETAAKRIKLPMERVFTNINKYGNTSAAAVGICLDEAQAQGRLKPGDKAVLVAFGAGLTWASAVIEW